MSAEEILLGLTAFAFCSGCGFIGFAFGAWRRKHMCAIRENEAFQRGFSRGFKRATQQSEPDPADWWKN